MRFFWSCLLLSTWMGVSAENPFLKGDKLDTEAVSAAYMDAEFESIKKGLENFLKRSGAAIAPEEKAIAFKYLGVIYGADERTVAKSETYFHLMLELAPNIQIIDMYPSDRVKAIFERVKIEFMAKKEYDTKYDAMGNPIHNSGGGGRVTAPASSSPSERKAGSGQIQGSGGRKWLWWGAGLLAAGAGIALYIWTDSSSEPERNVTEVTDN